ncbi:MAG: hypothetical protein QOE45_1449 [Frankiaceae bacterium]|jgi:hypothetical protein|nr:hypothetical protein [Frankiaceae bacterium]
MSEMDAVPGLVEPVEVGPETPEADAVEQAQADVEQATPQELRSIPDGVPEADALEQAYEVPVDDDYR